ncbi:MAG: hypothetical protein BBJ60_10425 [Desulfobacterales bacterium S7086C20]|nr:MAG: hypothetical protein BBJ60_10425 [Desulfobacterales bacterium S7086C20]
MIKANKAAIDMAIKPGVPMKIFAESIIGVSEFANDTESKIPTVAISNKVYNTVTMPTEASIPKGIFLWGFLTSSDMLAIFSKPPKDMKIKPAVTKIGLIPLGAKGLKYEALILGNPRTTYNAIRASRPITRKTWNLAAVFTPIIFKNTKQRQIIIEAIITSVPVAKKIISDMPNIAKALLSDKAAQPKKPDTVPTKGPKLLLIK